MQGGCGQTFLWSNAEAYKADTGRPPKVEAFVLVYATLSTSVWGLKLLVHEVLSY